MAKNEYLDYNEAEEIAACILGVEENDDGEYPELDDRLAERYDISMETFHEIAAKLFDMLVMSVSPLTETPYIGFGDGKRYLAKKETPRFVSSVIQWMGGEGEKGVKRDITDLDGNVLFEFIMKPVKNGKDGRDAEE